jgi:hypothetical protein
MDALGANLLVQTRAKILNNKLEEVSRRWYPRSSEFKSAGPDSLTHSKQVRT